MLTPAYVIDETSGITPAAESYIDTPTTSSPRLRDPMFTLNVRVPIATAET